MSNRWTMSIWFMCSIYSAYSMAQQAEPEQKENQVVSAKWSLNANYEADKGAIVINVGEEISKKSWTVSLGKDAYHNPAEAYDKIRPVIDGGNMEIVGGMPEDGQPLKVKITNGDEAYEWSLAQN